MIMTSVQNVIKMVESKVPSNHIFSSKNSTQILEILAFLKSGGTIFAILCFITLYGGGGTGIQTWNLLLFAWIDFFHLQGLRIILYRWIFKYILKLSNAKLKSGKETEKTRWDFQKLFFWQIARLPATLAAQRYSTLSRRKCILHSQLSTPLDA